MTVYLNTDGDKRYKYIYIYIYLKNIGTDTLYTNRRY